MTTKLLTDTEIERRLLVARDAERRARARVARLKRAAGTASRRLLTQRKCALGGVLLAIAARDTEADRRLVAFVRQFLAAYPPHPSNARALETTPFAAPAVQET